MPFKIEETHRRIAQSLHRWQTRRVELVPPSEWGKLPGWRQIPNGSEPAADEYMIHEFEFDHEKLCLPAERTPELLLKIDLWPMSCEDWMPYMLDLRGRGIVVDGMAGNPPVIPPLSFPTVPYRRLDGQVVHIRKAWKLDAERTLYTWVVMTDGTTEWRHPGGKRKLTDEEFMDAARGKRHELYEYDLHIRIGHGKDVSEFDYDWNTMWPHPHYVLTGKVDEYQGLLPEIKPPDAWERLQLDEGASGDVARLDGQTYRLNGLHAAAFLRALKDAKGLPILADALERTIGRPDRIYKTLPDELQRIIDKPGRGQPGYRMH